MNRVSSNDGTTIAYDKVGEGPALILVDGALSVHSSGGKAELAELLAPHFTVYGYDRRGRGGSGDTLPYAVDREIEDIEALISHAGGSAYLYGHSSGATLAMQAAVRLGGRVSKIAMYEAPHNDDPDAQQSWSEYLRELRQILAAGRRGRRSSAVHAVPRNARRPARRHAPGAVLAKHGGHRAHALLRPRGDHRRTLVGAYRPSCASVSSGPGHRGRLGLCVHASRGLGAEQRDGPRSTADPEGSDSRR
jgi:pimeloyl-ACP methyl ester carboxylesterase